MIILPEIRRRNRIRNKKYKIRLKLKINQKSRKINHNLVLNYLKRKWKNKCLKNHKISYFLRKRTNNKINMLNWVIFLQTSLNQSLRICQIILFNRSKRQIHLYKYLCLEIGYLKMFFINSQIKINKILIINPLKY